MEHVFSLFEQGMQGLDSTSGAIVLPLWVGAVLAALVVVFCLIALSRAGYEGIVGSLSRVSLLLVGAAMSWAVFAPRSVNDATAQRLALDQRALEMNMRALAPGSALACLDETAGDIVEASCEKAVFATAESTAAAVSYVAAELSLLADGSDYASRTGLSYESTLASLRHAAEVDRYGIWAHVLAVRDGCTPDQCSAFSLLHNASQVSDNLLGRKYENFVLRYASEWPAVAISPVAVNGLPPSLPVPTAAPAAAPPGKTSATSGLFFPSSASIPPVSIMSPEPGGAPPQAAGAPPDAGSKPPPPAHKPAAQQVRRPTNLNAQAQGRPATASVPAAPAPATAPAPAPTSDD